MIRLKMLAASVAISAVAVGTLSVAGAGAAGAATPPSPASHQGKLAATRDRQLLCQATLRHLMFAEYVDGLLAAHTTVFVTLETRAHDAGKTALANYWAKVVTDRDAAVARRHSELAALEARDATDHGLVGGKCT
jgi:hypothetical protein